MEFLVFCVTFLKFCPCFGLVFFNTYVFCPFDSMIFMNIFLFRLCFLLSSSTNRVSILFFFRIIMRKKGHTNRNFFRLRFVITRKTLLRVVFLINPILMIRFDLIQLLNCIEKHYLLTHFLEH